MKTELAHVFGNLAALPTTAVYLRSFLERAGKPKHPLHGIAAHGAREQIFRQLAICENSEDPYLDCIIKAALTYSGLEYGSTILLDEITRLTGTKAAFRPRSPSAKFAALRFRFHIPLHLFDANARALKLQGGNPLWKGIPESLFKELEPNGIRRVIAALSFAGRGGFGQTTSRAKEWMSRKGRILTKENVYKITEKRRKDLVVPTKSLVEESVPAMIAFYYPVVRFLFACFSDDDRQKLAGFLLALRNANSEGPHSWYKPTGEEVFVQGIGAYWPTAAPTHREAMLDWKIHEECLREVHWKLQMLRSVFASWEEFLLLSLLMLDSCPKFERTFLSDDGWQQFSVLLAKIAKQIEIAKIALSLHEFALEAPACANLVSLLEQLPRN